MLLTHTIVDIIMYTTRKMTFYPHISTTIYEGFRKPQFLNSGAKVDIMWGYKCGVKVYGVKVVFVNEISFGVNKYMAFHGLWCKPPKPILCGKRFCGAKHQR